MKTLNINGYQLTHNYDEREPHCDSCHFASQCKHQGCSRRPQPYVLLEKDGQAIRFEGVDAIHRANKVTGWPMTAE